MAKPHVLVTTSLGFLGGADENPIRQRFGEAGFQATFREASPGWPNDETKEKLAGVEAVLASAERFTPETLERADRLVMIARNGVGFDRVDLELCTERGIVVTNTPGVMADAVADLAMALLLATVRHIAAGDRTVKAGDYKIPLGEDLASMTLGLLGCGNIGAQVVRRALGFGIDILVCDPWVDSSRIDELGARAVPLDELLSESDAVSLHLPLTDESAGIVDEGFLGRMKPGSYLINTARGDLVDEHALIDALSRGHIAGAGLDCQKVEPPEGKSLELVRMHQVVASPHVASSTFTARRRMSLMAAGQIVDCLEGRVPQHVVNRDVLDKLDLASV